MLKTELHSHSSDDPWDLIPYDTVALIARAADRGYHALAITLHDRQLNLAPFAGFARERGVTLIPGIERTIEGTHALLLNFSAGRAEAVRSFDDLRRLRTREAGLVVAPHPFFPLPSCLQSKLSVHRDVFDAIEYNGMYTSAVNFNVKAVQCAREYGLPLVGNGDVHRLDQLDTTWSMIDAEPDAESICTAIREGRVRLDSRPHSSFAAAQILGDMFLADVRRTLSGARRAAHRQRGTRRLRAEP